MGIKKSGQLPPIKKYFFLYKWLSHRVVAPLHPQSITYLRTGCRTVPVVDTKKGVHTNRITCSGNMLKKKDWRLVAKQTWGKKNADRITQIKR
jgi:hypothetical protein